MQGLGVGYKPSPRPSIDLLYDIEQIMNPSRLTKALPSLGNSINRKKAKDRNK